MKKNIKSNDNNKFYWNNGNSKSQIYLNIRRNSYFIYDNSVNLLFIVVTLYSKMDGMIL